MRVTFCLLLALTVRAGEVSPGQRIWSELETKRLALQSAHQEFEVVWTYKSGTGQKESRSKIILDMSRNVWREKDVSGSGTMMRIFDGDDAVRFEEGGEEYVRLKGRPKGEVPVPAPYRMADADWSKAKEVERRPCALPKVDHNCVLLSVPIKPSVRSAGAAGTTRVLQGTHALLVDLETGLLLAARSAQLIEDSRRSYNTEVSYNALRMSFGGKLDAELFRVPSGLKEVKELSMWDVAKIKKQLLGELAPAWTANDLSGKPVSLADLKGKMVLLDFWTTWCPPCRQDAPSLDKLYEKYGAKDLVIVGVSVSEERTVVEKFLREHPHSFPIVLTTENEMPRPFQIGVFPTYIVIDKDGKVAGAAQGDQGFGDLRKMLKKGGLEAD